MACEGCSLCFDDIIANFKGNDEAATGFFQYHDVLPTVKLCPTCNRECLVNSEGFFAVKDRKLARKVNV